jgi:hypothetical protein
MAVRQEPTEFTGHKLLDLVTDIEKAVGRHSAGRTPLGRAVTDLCEIRKFLNRE